ncbi:MAG: ABC transporter ATP-binding protein [Endomicrobium sp.]|jgi:iron complex transport system ATP-binding protein|nr:ABC transporter ATP-binding protein [Endomicrobium sp.]
MIKVRNIYAKYISRSVLTDCSFDIHNKDFIGIIGKNGAGKSTLLKILCKVIPPYTGNILIDNKDISHMDNAELAKTVSFLPQNVNTDLSFTVLNFILFGRYPYMNRLKFPSRNDYNIVYNIIKILNLQEKTKIAVNNLSDGEKQKVLIGQVLAQQTDVIILDEPTSHLDIGNRNVIFNLLKKLNTQYGKTIIITVHDLNIASAFCNQFIILDNGIIYKKGTPLEVFQCGILEKIYNIKFIIQMHPTLQYPYILLTSK